MQKLLVVVPVCNEARSLEHFLPRLRGAIGGVVRGVSVAVDVVVIDDGSTDDTARVVRDQGYHLVTKGENRGLGHSLRHGYRLGCDGDYDFLVTMDSDGQHDPKLLGTVIERLTIGVELVTCSRYHPRSERFSPPLDRDLLNVSVTAMLHAVTGWKHLTDPLTGFWGMNARVMAFLAATLKLERYGTCLEGLIKMWYLMEPRPRLEEIPHPAIYTANGDGFLNRVYSPGQQEERVERFGTHARHIILALHDVVAAGHEDAVVEAIRAWRASVHD